MTSWTKKRRVFLEEYLKCWNATEAARRAGYKFPNVTGTKLVKTSIIAQEIQKRLKEKAMDADEVLARLGEQGRANIADFIEQGGAIDWDAVREKGHLVKKITHTPGKQSLIELHDAQSALVHIGRHHQLFTDKVKVEGWRDEIINLLREGLIPPELVKNDLGEELARELFKSAGIKVL